MLAEPSVHSRARMRIERPVGDIAHERKAEVDVISLFVANSSGKKPNQRLLVRKRAETEDVDGAERTARHRQPVDDRMLERRQLLQAIGDELLEGGGQRLGALAGALYPNERVVGS